MIIKYKDKKDYQSVEEMWKAKDNLFSMMSIEEIIEELALNNIIILEEETYVMLDTTSCDEVIEYYHEKYDEQLDLLGEKQQTFDDDAVGYLIVKMSNK